MTASAPALTREVEVQSKIRKVSTFSRFARVVCSAFFGFGLVGAIGLFLLGALGALGVIPSRVESGFGFSPIQKMWALPMFVAFASIWLAVVFQFYRLFSNLAAGAIYTSENVSRVRRVGLLWLLAGVLGIVIPVAWAAFVKMGLVDPADLPTRGRWPMWSDSLNGLMSGGLIVLVSWVMDVGLYEKDQAAELKRDADLVI